MAAPANACPKFWETIVPGAAEGMAKITKRQEDIDACNGNITALTNLHSMADSSDPLNIEAFEPELPTEGADNIRATTTEAQAGIQAVGEALEASKGKIEEHMQALQDTDLPGVATTVEAKKQEAQAELRTKNEKLEDYVKVRKGLEELITSVPELNITSVEGMDDTKKERKFEEGKAFCIADRMSSVIQHTGNEKLCKEDQWSDKFGSAKQCKISIQAHNVDVAQLEERAALAKQKKDASLAIVENIKKAQVKNREQRAGCEAAEEATAIQLRKDQQEVEKCWLALEKATQKCDDTKIKHEAHIARGETLETNEAHLDAMLVEAELAIQEAVETCDEWETYALAKKAELSSLIKAKVAECKSMLSATARVPAFNVSLAQQLLSQAVQDNDAELDTINEDQATYAAREQELDQTQDADTKKAFERASIRDKQAVLLQRKGKCEVTKQELETNMQAAKAAWDNLAEFVNDSKAQEEVKVEAKMLSNDLYKKFKLFQPVAPSPAPVAAVPYGGKVAAPVDPSSALAAIPPNVMDMLKKMAADEARKMNEQFKVEFMLSQAARAASSNSGPPSEAGDWEKIGFPSHVEHHSIASAASVESDAEKP